eukprot:1250491-Alexandrium_andersonii.AAC.1
MKSVGPRRAGPNRRPACAYGGRAPLPPEADADVGGEVQGLHPDRDPGRPQHQDPHEHGRD